MEYGLVGQSDIRRILCREVLISCNTHLVVEFLEVLRCVGVSIRCCIVLHPPALLHQQSAQPAILTCRE